MGEQKLLKVVYDVDDVLWGLNRRVERILGIDKSRNVEYCISRSPTFSPAEQSAIMKCFHDAETFKQMAFFPGASEILDCEPYGATVRIHSNCLTAAIAEQKRIQLHKLLPSLKPAFIKLSVVTPAANRKAIDQDAYIFVDDSPYNIASSTAKFNLVPRQPWNQTDKAKSTMTADGKQIVSLHDVDLSALINSRHRYIIYSKNLREINQTVIDIIKLKQGGINHGE